MSDNLEQAPGTGGEVKEPPQPCKPRDASSATALAVPSLRSSRRVRFRISLSLRCALQSKGRSGHLGVDMAQSREKRVRWVSACCLAARSESHDTRTQRVQTSG